MKTFNKNSAIIWFSLSALALILALAKWSFVCLLLAMLFTMIGKVAWREYKELKQKEDIYNKFKKSNN